MSTISHRYRQFVSRVGLDRTHRTSASLLAVRQNKLLVASSPVARPSEDNLGGLISMCVSEVALMWLLHQRALLPEARAEPLIQQIMNFSSVVFRAIAHGSDDLRDIKQSYLWLLYFKGLITAHTHPQDQMIEAIGLIKDSLQDGEPTMTSGSSPPLQLDLDSSTPVNGMRPVAGGDDETLAQIAQALTLLPREP